MRAQHAYHTEFSKLVLLYDSALETLVIVYTLLFVTFTGNSTPLEILIPAVLVQFSAGKIFYYWKAKAENVVKLKQKYGVDLTIEESDTDA